MNREHCVINNIRTLYETRVGCIIQSDGCQATGIIYIIPVFRCAPTIWESAAANMLQIYNYGITIWITSSCMCLVMTDTVLVVFEST